MIYKRKPKVFNPKFEVVSCFVEEGGKILLLHRQDHKPQGGTWGVPAGKIEIGESIVDATSRELFEETGNLVSPNLLQHLHTVFVKYDDYDFVYHILKFVPTVHLDVTLEEKAHKGYKWMTPQEALAMPLIQDLDACIELCYN